MGLTIDEFKKAFESLDTANKLYKNSLKDDPSNNDLHMALRDSCIQRFEYCIELSWKISMKILGLDTKAPNPAIREMAQNGLINNPRLWLNFVLARNKTSHAYQEDLARAVYEEVDRILPELRKLFIKLKEKSTDKGELK